MEEMEAWKTIGIQDAEREFEEIAQEMLEEVSLSVPIISQPMNVSVAPYVSAPQFSVKPHLTIPHSVGNSSDSSFRDM